MVGSGILLFSLFFFFNLSTVDTEVTGVEGYSIRIQLLCSSVLPTLAAAFSPHSAALWQGCIVFYVAYRKKWEVPPKMRERDDM